jgi:hypothetical protein
VAGNTQQPNQNSGVDSALSKVNQAQIKLSHERGKAQIASRPVSLQDKTGRWVTMPHSQAVQHIKGGKKKSASKRVAAKQE